MPSDQTVGEEGCPSYEDQSLQPPLPQYAFLHLLNHKQSLTLPERFSYHFWSATYKAFRALR